MDQEYNCTADKVNNLTAARLLTMSGRKIVLSSISDC